MAKIYAIIENTIDWDGCESEQIYGYVEEKNVNEALDMEMRALVEKCSQITHLRFEQNPHRGKQIKYCKWNDSYTIYAKELNKLI